jgi:hypothetical protein
MGFGVDGGTSVAVRYFFPPGASASFKGRATSKK